MTVIFIRAGQLLRLGRDTDAVSLVEKTLEQNRERYDANYIAALFNMFAGRFETAELLLARAGKVVGADYPVIKGAVMTLASLRDPTCALEKIDEIIELARNHRVLYITFLAGNARRVTEAWQIALDQKHDEVFHVLFQPKPPMMSESAWVRIQAVTHAAAANLGSVSGEFVIPTGYQELLEAFSGESTDDEMDS